MQKPRSLEYLALQAARYEKLRTLDPRAFSELWTRALQPGAPSFDAQIDALIQKDAERAN